MISRQLDDAVTERMRSERRRRPATITVELIQAPTTPLNLRFGDIYAPRIGTPPFVGFRAIELTPDVYAVEAFDANGLKTEVFRGDIAATFFRLALHLRMDTNNQADA